MTPTTNNKKRFNKVLIAMFVLAVFMGTGPGILLVNQATVIMGVPLIYAWAVLWYTVQSAVVLLAYAFGWRGTDSANGTTDR